MKDNNMKFVVMGDGLVGKTRLVRTFAYNKPTENVSFPITMGGKKDFYTKSYGHNGVLTIYDSAGQLELKNPRSDQCKNTDAIILAFSFTNKSSLENITGQWLKELQKNKVFGIPIVLVGLGKNEYNSANNNHIDPQINNDDIVNQLSSELRTTVKYVTCSLQKLEEVKTVFNTARELVSSNEYSHSFIKRIGFC